MLKILNIQDDPDLKNEQYITDLLKMNSYLMIKFISYENDIVMKTSIDFWILLFENLIKSKS
jgi:hypothetical protein